MQSPENARLMPWCTKPSRIIGSPTPVWRNRSTVACSRIPALIVCWMLSGVSCRPPPSRRLAGAACVRAALPGLLRQFRPESAWSILIGEGWLEPESWFDGRVIPHVRVNHPGVSGHFTSFERRG